MNNLLTGLEDAVAALRGAWAGSDGVVPDVSGLSRDRLVSVTTVLGVVGRRLDAVRAQVAAEVDRESRRELGPDSLAKQQGFRTAATLIAAVTGVSTGDAARLAKVGRATVPRTTLTGETRPARHPHVAAALGQASITAAAADLMISMLDRVALRVPGDDCDRAERVLVDQAPGLSLDALRRVITRAEAWLDPDGLEPAEYDRHGQRSASLYERDGMLHVTATIDTASGAPLKTAVEALVSAAFRHTRDDVTAGDDDRVRPTVQQLQADALVQLAEHALGCDRGELPLDGATVVVRMSLDDLRESAAASVGRCGVAEIDGMTQPLSIAAARHLASSAGIIPCVLDGAGEILDWGRRRRLFTPAQKLALVERDGGCAMCNLPPGMTKAHHLEWWARDEGATDLSNGVLLCESCHHRIHDNGWDVRIDGGTIAGKVWFIPPPTVDPVRVPRLGGRARFDFAPPARAA